MEYYKPYNKRTINDIECFYDVFRQTWRPIKYYERYLERYKKIEGVYQHIDGKVIKIKSFLM